jgi:hypothetical protein
LEFLVLRAGTEGAKKKSRHHGTEALWIGNRFLRRKKICTYLLRKERERGREKRGVRAVHAVTIDFVYDLSMVVSVFKRRI